jgi:hypothetical protein
MSKRLSWGIWRHSTEDFEERFSGPVSSPSAFSVMSDRMTGQSRVASKLQSKGAASRSAHANRRSALHGQATGPLTVNRVSAPPAAVVAAAASVAVVAAAVAAAASVAVVAAAAAVVPVAAAVAAAAVAAAVAVAATIVAVAAVWSRSRPARVIT